MSDYELEPNDSDGGDLAPYQPNMPLSSAPVPDSTWMVPQPDFLSEHPQYQSAPRLFGQALPPGATQAHAEQALNQIATVFEKDMAQLGFDSWMVNAATNWFKSNALLPPAPEIRRHHYRLDGFRIPDQDKPAVESFLNCMADVNAPLRFVQAALWWVDQLGKQQTPQPQTQSPSQNDITDAEWKIIERRCESDKAACDAALRNYFGNQYRISMRLISEYLDTLPVQDRERLEMTVCKGGLLSGNSFEVVVGIYQAAIGANSLPSGGSAIADEIAQIERLMRTNRKAYLADERLQARYRELLTRRDG